MTKPTTHVSEKLALLQSHIVYTRSSLQETATTWLLSHRAHDRVGEERKVVLLRIKQNREGGIET